VDAEGLVLEVEDEGGVFLLGVGEGFLEGVGVGGGEHY
jgi:hypothetical protein